MNFTKEPCECAKGPAFCVAPQRGGNHQRKKAPIMPGKLARQKGVPTPRGMGFTPVKGQFSPYRPAALFSAGAGEKASAVIGVALSLLIVFGTGIDDFPPVKVAAVKRPHENFRRRNVGRDRNVMDIAEL